jgi:hypothetical protein
MEAAMKVTNKEKLQHFSVLQLAPLQTKLLMSSSTGRPSL